jgi:hypothetical protein
MCSAASLAQVKSQPVASTIAAAIAIPAVSSFLTASK